MNATEKLLHFGVFELNLETAELRKAGTIVKLPPQPFKLLVLLASHAGQVVTRDDIQKQLWGEETFVDFDQGVNKCIKQIRAALNDNADKPLYVETLPRHGYRFLAPVVSETVPAPQPSVKESSFGQLRNVPLQVRAGVVASYPAPPFDGSQPIPAKTIAAPTLETKSAARGVRPRMWSVTIIIIALIAGGLYWYWDHSHQEKANALTEKDVIVVADFNNNTGDEIFDGTLRQALTIELEQSPYLNVLTDRQMTDILTEMGRPKNDRLTEDVTREICLRTNSRAYLAGSIVQIGDHYLIGLRTLNCETDHTLASVAVEAQNRNAVLRALDAAAVSLRRKLGESLRSVQTYAEPMERATAPSLEALKAYSLGQMTRFAKGETAALPFYKRAVEIDPNFAMAYRAMSMAYGNLGEIGQATENARKAYELRERVSERERFAIEANYYDTATQELEKAARTYELWRQTYPRDYVPYGNLGGIYDKLGDLDRALEEDRGAMRLQPSQETVYANLGGDYANLNRLDEAEAVYEQAEKRKLEGESLLANRYTLAFLKGDTAKMAWLVSAAMGKPGTEYVLLASQAATEAWYGKLSNSREFVRRAMDSAQRNDAKEAAALYEAFAALEEAESGNRARARAEADAAVKLAPNREVLELAALALARAGDTATAKKLAAELDHSFPLGTLVQRYWLPTIYAAVALEHNAPNRAVELLNATTAIELGDQGNLCPVFLRGEAYLKLRNGNAAAGEFQKFIEHRGLVANTPWGALARLGLARAYALDAATDLASRDKARAAYQNFLALWKDADPDIPVLQQAKAEYRNLQ